VLERIWKGSDARNPRYRDESFVAATLAPIRKDRALWVEALDRWAVRADSAQGNFALSRLLAAT
jgi:hypothetical protein